MRNLIAVIGLAFMVSVQAQGTNPIAGGFPTNPPAFDTNALTQAAGGSAVASFGLSLLPYWDKNFLAFTNKNELELAVGPAWKSATASGNTPFIDVSARYWLTKNWGFGGDMLTFGSGSGNSDLDSGHAYFMGRKASGNVAAFFILGGGRDKVLNEWAAEFGGGIQFRYKTGIGLEVGTRYVRFIEKNAANIDHEFITAISTTIHF
jgi:hypothetical protein